MKKVIVVLMVLALVSAASADISWNVSLDGTNTIALIELVGTNIAGFALGNPSIVTPIGGTWSSLYINPTFDTGATTSAGSIATGGANIGNLMNVKGGFSSTIGVYVTGTVWSATFTWDSPITEDVLFDVGAGWANDKVGVLNPAGDFIVPVPEPMSMALLGLGGLFLRRRK